MNPPDNQTPPLPQQPLPDPPPVPIKRGKGCILESELPMLLVKTRPA